MRALRVVSAHAPPPNGGRANFGLNVVKFVFLRSNERHEIRREMDKEVKNRGEVCVGDRFGDGGGGF